MTWEEWQVKWEKCVKCPIGEIAFSHVLGTGPKDAVILYLGEGPGKSEDALGKAFIGRAGALLKQAILQAHGNPDRMYFSNLIACRPTDGPTDQNRKPTDFEMGNCRDRLKELVTLLNPQGIVYVGQMARAYAKPTVSGMGWGGGEFFIYHPAALLRRGGTKASDYPKYVAELHRFFDNFKEISHGGR